MYVFTIRIALAKSRHFSTLSAEAFILPKRSKLYLTGLNSMRPPIYCSKKKKVIFPSCKYFLILSQINHSLIATKFSDRLTSPWFVRSSTLTKACSFEMWELPQYTDECIKISTSAIFQWNENRLNKPNN